MQPDLTLDSKAAANLIAVVAHCVGVELLGRELSTDELMCITRRVAPLIRSYRHESNSVQRKKLTPPQVAKMLGVNCDKVLGWIRRGELRAVNVAANPNGRPRYRIDADDLRAFENQRSLTPKSPTRTRRQRKKQNVIKYF